MYYIDENGKMIEFVKLVSNVEKVDTIKPNTEEAVSKLTNQKPSENKTNQANERKKKEEEIEKANQIAEEEERREKSKREELAQKQKERNYIQAIETLKGKITMNNTKSLDEAIKNMGQGTKSVYINQLKEIGGNYPQGYEHKKLINLLNN